MTASTVLSLHRIPLAILSLGGVVLFALGIGRMPAHLHDLPGNVAADALHAGEKLSPAAVFHVLETRMRSVRSHPTAQRWFALGYAYTQSANPEKSHRAFERGLLTAPADGVIWAAYARALERAGEAAAAAAACAQLVDRARHDPRAVRLRRN